MTSFFSLHSVMRNVKEKITLVLILGKTANPAPKPAFPMDIIKGTSKRLTGVGGGPTKD